MSQPKDRLPLQEVTTLSQSSREKAGKVHNGGNESQLVDLTAEPQENGTRSASNIVQLAIPKAKNATKPRTAPAKKTIAPKLKKSKADAEFDKLTPQQQLEFLHSRSDLLRNLDAQKQATASVASGLAEPAAIEDKTENSDLCALRLELGSVLSQEAELRARERKLRLAIKRLQRKLIMAQSPIVCKVRESIPMDRVVTTLFNSTSITVEKERATARPTAGIAATASANSGHNALWVLAQQSDMFDTAVAARLLDVERDATLREHPSLPSEASAPLGDEDTCVERDATLREHPSLPAEASAPLGDEDTCVEGEAQLGICAMHAAVAVDGGVDSELTSTSPAAEVELEVSSGCDAKAGAAGGAGQLPLVLFGQSESLYETDIYATEEQLGELEFDSSTMSQVLLSPLPGVEAALCPKEDATLNHPDCALEEVGREPAHTEEVAELSAEPREVKRKGLFQHFAYTAEAPAAPAAKRHKPVVAPASASATSTGTAALLVHSQPASLFEVIDLTSPQAQAQSGAPRASTPGDPAGEEPPRPGPRKPAPDADKLVDEVDSAGYTPECPAGVIHYLPSGPASDPRAGDELAGSAPVCTPAASRDPVPMVPIPTDTAAVEESQVSGNSTSSKESDCSILSSPEMPDFASLPVQKLRDILLHYGLKVDTKSKMVSLLRAMWQRLHKEGVTKATALSKARYVQATGGRPSIASVFAPGRSAQSVASVASETASAEAQEPSRATEATAVGSRKRKSEEVEAAEVVAFLRLHPAWYEQVLTFVPLDLDRLHTELHAALADPANSSSHTTGSLLSTSGAAPVQRASGRRISKARLLEVLDQHAVFVSRSGKISTVPKASQH